MDIMGFLLDPILVNGNRLQAQKVLLFSGNSPGARWEPRRCGSEAARW
jgi:hypothetical protein